MPASPTRSSASTSADSFSAEERTGSLVAACAGALCCHWNACATMVQAVASGKERSCFQSCSIQQVLQRFSCQGPAGFEQALLKPPPTMPPVLPGGVARLVDLQQGGSVVEVMASRLADSDNPESSAEAALLELVAPVLRAGFETAERHRPSAEAVLTGVAPQQRCTLLLWLLQVCDIRGIPDTVLYMTISLFDRYSAVVREPIPCAKLQRVVLATLSIAMKVNGGEDDAVRYHHLISLLTCLGQQQHSAAEIFQEELRVLQALDFSVTAPTALDFLNTYLVPFVHPERPEAASPVVIMSKFLLQLSLLDPVLHCRWPLAVLAAGSVYVALWCTQAKLGRVVALISDVTTTCMERPLGELTDSEVPPFPSMEPEEVQDLAGELSKLAVDRANGAGRALRRL